MVGADGPSNGHFEVNEIVRHWPETCSGCGVPLSGGPEPDGQRSQEGQGYTRRQVHDIPPIKKVALLGAIEVTEHRAMAQPLERAARPRRATLQVKCDCCGTTTVGSYPEGVEQEVQYGNGVKAWLTYASVYQLLPMERNTEMLADMAPRRATLIGRQVSEGTIANALATCAEQVAPVEAQIKVALKVALRGAIGSEVLNADETKIRVDKDAHWLHVSSTPAQVARCGALTHYSVDKQRGADAHERIGILPNFSGVAVHDRYKSFDKAPDRVLHSYCNAHILRDLTAMAPRSLAARSRGWATFEELTNQSWPGKMKTLLLDMKAQVEQARTAGLKVAQPSP